MNSPQRELVVRSLRQRAEESQFSQIQIAQKSGISQPQVSRFLAGRFVHPSKGLIKLCKFFECWHESNSITEDPGEALKQALLRVWDGSPQHERALINLLNALKPAMRRP